MNISVNIIQLLQISKSILLDLKMKIKMSINILQKREISENILEERGKEIEKEIGRSEQNKEKLNTSEVIKDPLEQFEIRDLISLDLPIIDNIHISLTNIALYLVISVILLSVIMINSNNLKKIKSNFWSLWQESLYDIIYNLVINQINLKKGEIFFPFIYSIFMFILINNLISMIPYSFATTSHFILTFFISFTIVLGATIVGFNKHGLKFFSLFVPAGCPLALLPVLVLIEFISYLTRNISLGLRLAANIFSGHMLLNILSGFTYNIMTSGFLFFFFSLLPLSFIIAFSGLELGIAFIQSQVFVVLSCSYIKDALELH